LEEIIQKNSNNINSSNKTGRFNKTAGNGSKGDKKINKSVKKVEEEIEKIENENDLFDDEGYFKGQEEVNEDDWNNNSKSLNLANILLNKMNEVQEKKLDNRIIEAFTLVGDVLRTYTSGKLPKAFNILPVTENWEELIQITKPETWTPQAMYEATKMFCSNLNANLSETFYSTVLLPGIREDIKKHKKLNIHYYNCLKKAIFKPSGFFKGLIIPLAESCSAKEAAVIGSIIRKCSIPVYHSSACLMKLIENCQNKINMGCLFFIKILLLKKYALPTTVKESLVKFFFSFLQSQYYADIHSNESQLPVLWHQTLLIFIQIYKFDLTDEEKGKLRVLINAQHHHLITEDIIRELNYNKPIIKLSDNMNLD